MGTRLAAMSTLPPVTMSSLDHSRLERLLETGENSRLPGIDALQREMDRATLVAPAEVPASVVTMNSTIRFVDDASGTRHEFTLVYPADAGKPGTISVLAPVGSALLGLSVGQSIRWPAPGGRELDLRVLEVVRQPEAMGELHR